jgi:hypothetical protein
MPFTLEFFIGFHGSLVVLWVFPHNVDLDGNAKSKREEMLMRGRE